MQENSVLEIGRRYKKLISWSKSLLEFNLAENSHLSGLLETYQALLAKLARNRDDSESWKQLHELERKLDLLYCNKHLWSSQKKGMDNIPSNNESILRKVRP